MAISVAVRGRRTAATRWSRRSSRACAALKIGAGDGCRSRTWARSSRAQHRDKVRGLHRHRRAARARRSSSTAAACKMHGPRGRLFRRRRRCSTTSRPTCASTGRRSSARCWSWCASPDFDERVGLDQRARVRQWHGDLHARRRRGARLRAASPGRHGRRQRADSRADGVPFVRRLEASLFGDHHMHGPEGVRFYTRLKTVTARWPTGVRAGAKFIMPTMR